MTKLTRVMSALLSGGALALVAPTANAAWGLNMTQGVSDISRRIYDLHMTILWVCVAIGIFVFGWMIWSIVAFRKSKGAVPDTTLTHSTKVEVIWTVIPVLILIGSAVPAGSACPAAVWWHDAQDCSPLAERAVSSNNKVAT